jgi:hypothetical protein
MVSAFLLSCALAGAASPADVQPSRADLDSYEAARTKAGHDADTQVKLALWCEAHGLSAERIKHLARAILINPNHVAARGLLGLVESGGKWQKPAEVGQQLASDPQAKEQIGEYLKRRAATPDKADSQWKLAQWCEQNGLSEQAQAHYWAVVRLDRRREAAWKKLGYRKIGDGWARPEQITSEKAEAEKQRLATKRWRPILERERDGLRSKDPGRQARAATALAQITDPRAVPAVWEILASGDQKLQLAAVQVLGQIDGPWASQAAVALALFSPYPEVRGRSIETAARRDPRDFLEPLLAMIRRPFRYKVQPLAGPGSQGGIFVDGERFNIQRLYQVAPIDLSRLPQRIFSPDVPFNPFTAANMMMVSGWGTGSVTVAPSVPAASATQLGKAIAGNPASATAAVGRAQATTSAAWGDVTNLVFATQMAAMDRDRQIAQVLDQMQQQMQQAQQGLAQDIQTVESWNEGIRTMNDRVLPIVKTATGQDLGTDRDAWLKWWNDELGYAYQSPTTEEKPTYTELVTYPMNITPPHCSCFAAGTSVQTIDGARAIEKLSVGDQVLTQNTTTGALSFQPVLVVHHNPPSPTLKLRIGAETLVATGIHRFWKAGSGWTMARDFKPGDTVRTVGGAAKIESVEPGTVQPVFNLDVARNRDFFVGAHGCLVYDFSIVQPVSAPFDHVPDLAAMASTSK